MNETLPFGKYFIGDPSSVLHTKIYIGIWGNVYNYENGKFNIFGHDIIFHSTHSGDGTFKDTRDRQYSIESGVISLINMELIEDIGKCKNGHVFNSKSCKNGHVFNSKSCKNGHVFNFTSDVNFIYDAGMIYIKSGKKYITINTRKEDGSDYDSECDELQNEHCLNEDGEPITKTLCGDSDDDFIEEEDLDLDSDDEIVEKSEDISLETKRELFQFFKKR
jgi:hypothetical protein